ncbi:MAG: hypothetical protein ACYDAB_14860 [bacterium]
MLYSLPEHHLNGRVFLGLRGRRGVDPDGYFEVIRLVRPLLASNDFIVSTPGLFINYIRDQDVPNGALRLNYFTINAGLTIDTIEDFVAASGDLAIVRREHADRSTSLADYDEGADKAELNFRNFLDANTRICLDMLESFGEHSLESLVAIYRYLGLPRGMRPEAVLEEEFGKHSKAFNELRDRGLAGIFWNDLVHVHRTSDVGLHFMVNLVTLPDVPYGL